MKRFLILLLSFMTIIASYSQNLQDRAFYVYRNDGIFNAFYNSEVDSIKYSCLSIDSIECENVVTQEIWTSDSVYRIPLNVIDSISFVKPETSYKPNVIRLNDEYMPYIVHSDSLFIKFDKKIPRQLIPKKGDILLYEGFNDLFSTGFVGRVHSVVNDDNFFVKCDSVEFEDVYDELILLGDYVLQEDKQHSSKYRLVPQRIAGEIPLTVSVAIRESIGPITLNGSVTQGIKLRLVIRLKEGASPYVEMQVKDEETLNIDAIASAESSGFRQIGNKLFGISIPIPNCPALKFNYATSAFGKVELKAESSFGIEMSSKGQTSYIYNGNKWKTIQQPRISEQKTTSKTGINGSLWLGVVESIRIATIKNFLSVGADIYVGPKMSGNIDFNIGDGVASSTMYEALKDSKIDLTIRFESDIAFRWRLSKKNTGYTPLFNIVPGIELYMGEIYLLPLFTKPMYSIEKTDVTVTSDVSRTLLLPCAVGFRLFNNGKTEETHYNDRIYWLDDNFSDKLSTVFNGLKYNEKYKVRPMVKIFGWEMEATPETEFSHGLYVYTGGANVSYTEAKCDGGASVDNSSDAIASVVNECGFLYNTTGTPQIGNANKISCTMPNDGIFNTILSGLTEDTQYFYTAFVRIDEDYYYGETKSFKTKKKNIPDPDPNPAQNPTATTGGHYDETATTATIECIYEHIPTDADCGYYLRTQKDSTIISNVSQSAGNVEGKRIFHLTNLKSATTYYYQAYVHYNGNEYLGTEKTFQTLVPKAITGDYSDITDKSAIIECTYTNIPEGSNCGVEYNWYNGSTKQRCGSSSGTRKISLGGLEPLTTYTYCAYVEADGVTYYGEDKTFITDAPDISGTWSCVETYYINGNYNNPQYRTYTIVLNEDDKAEVNNGEDYNRWDAYDGWSWSLNGNKLSMECTLIASQTQYSGYKISGTVDDIKNPQKITGRRFNWNFNQYGSFESDGWEIIMTR